MKTIMCEIGTCLTYAAFPIMALIWAYLSARSLDGWLFGLYHDQLLLWFGIFSGIGAVVTMLYYFLHFFHVKDGMK